MRWSQGHLGARPEGPCPGRVLWSWGRRSVSGPQCWSTLGPSHLDLRIWTQTGRLRQLTPPWRCSSSGQRSRAEPPPHGGQIECSEHQNVQSSLGTPKVYRKCLSNSALSRPPQSPPSLHPAPLYWSSEASGTKTTSPVTTPSLRSSSSLCVQLHPSAPSLRPRL